MIDPLWPWRHLWTTPMVLLNPAKLVNYEKMEGKNHKFFSFLIIFLNSFFIFRACIKDTFQIDPNHFSNRSYFFDFFFKRLTFFSFSSILESMSKLKPIFIAFVTSNHFVNCFSIENLQLWRSNRESRSLSYKINFDLKRLN